MPLPPTTHSPMVPANTTRRTLNRPATGVQIPPLSPQEEEKLKKKKAKQNRASTYNAPAPTFLSQGNVMTTRRGAY